jgi:hypothetical protein
MAVSCVSSWLKVSLQKLLSFLHFHCIPPRGQRHCVTRWLRPPNNWLQWVPARVARWFMFNTKNPNLGTILEGLGLEYVGIFYGHLVWFVAVWYSLWPFGIFSRLDQEKSGNPGASQRVPVHKKFRLESHIDSFRSDNLFYCLFASVAISPKQVTLWNKWPRNFAFFWSETPCASPPPGTSDFFYHSFLVHHPVNWDDQVMGSDFPVAWQFSQREQLGFNYRSNCTPNQGPCLITFIQGWQLKQSNMTQNKMPF